MKKVKREKDVKGKENEKKMEFGRKLVLIR